MKGAWWWLGLFAASCAQDIGVLDPHDAGPIADATPLGPSDVATSDGGAVFVDAGLGPVEAGAADADAADAGAEDASWTHDVGYVPNERCEALEVECAPATTPMLVEVPTEASATEAFATAMIGDTIQIRGRSLGSGFRVPPYVTLRGCDGARIEGSIAFSDGSGTVEGFAVTGSIIANRTGTFVVRRNRFEGTERSAGVSARSVDALVSASVEVIVEGNEFEERPLGVEARTRYDTMTHAVSLSVRNNVFDQVARPIAIEENGLVGHIDATIESNTFARFSTAVQLRSVSSRTVVDFNILWQGATGIDSDSPFQANFTFVHDVMQPHTLPPVGGVVTAMDPGFVDGAQGDYRLAPSSPLIDVISVASAVPSPDFYGCPRPVAIRGPSARADPGAIEAQP